MKGQTVDARDLDLTTERREIHVARGPRGAAVLDAAGLAGGQGAIERHAVADVQRRLDRTSGAAELLVDAPTKGDECEDREGGERQPLCPIGPGSAGEPEQPDDGGRDAEEHEIELRVDHEHFGAEQDRAYDEPSPPRHES